MKTSTTKKMKPQNIDEYIAATPKETQKRLRDIRNCIRKAAPGADEGLKWSMPAFSYKRILVTFAVFKNHIGFYPTPSAVETFAPALAQFKTARGSIQFPHDRPLPLPLIREITAFRVHESLGKDEKWRSPKGRMQEIL